MINKIKAKLYALLFWQTRIGEFLNKGYDLRIFLSNSFTENKIKSKESFQAFLTKQYHIVEKGLALPNPRKGFGKLKISTLIKKAEGYKNIYGEDQLIKNIQETLHTYLERNRELKEYDNDFYKLIFNFINSSYQIVNGGVKKVTKHEIQNAVNIDFELFIKSRSSVRDFSTEEVLDDEIYKSIDLARYTPSVCNRQSWKVHYYKDELLKEKLLKLQNGNNGFSESINKLIIVTTDTKKFTKLEGNQVFVDGGMFAMSLVLSLHAQGIASCCLNTCLPYVDEKKIKSIGDIPPSERLIMMIGIGKYKDDFEVAISNRITVEELINNKDKGH